MRERAAAGSGRRSAALCTTHSATTSTRILADRPSYGINDGAARARNRLQSSTMGARNGGLVGNGRGGAGGGRGGGAAAGLHLSSCCRPRCCCPLRVRDSTDSLHVYSRFGPSPLECRETVRWSAVKQSVGAPRHEVGALCHDSAWKIKRCSQMFSSPEGLCRMSYQVFCVNAFYELLNTSSKLLASGEMPCFRNQIGIVSDRNRLQ